MTRSALRGAGLALVFLLCGFALSAQRTVKAGNLSRLLLPVKQGGKWGYADTSRNIIIAPQFDAANPFEQKIAVVEMKRKAFAIDSTGRILTPGFDQLFILEDSILGIYLNVVSDTLGGWGLCTIHGQLILPTAFDEVSDIGAGLFSFRKDSLWGIVDRSGRILAQPEYTSVSLLQQNFLLLQRGNKFGVMSKEGTLLLEPRYNRILLPNKKLVAGYLPNKKDPRARGWGGVNLSAEQIIPFRFDSLFRVNEYFTGVKCKDSLACCFSYGNGALTPAIYQQLAPLDLYWIKLYGFNGNCGLADTLGNIFIPVAYRDIAIGGRGTWFVSDTAKKWGLCASDGTLLVAPTYSRIQPFRANVTVVYDNALQGLINLRGEVLVPPDNQQIIVRGNTVKVMRSDSSATFLTIDNNGRITSRSDYDEFRVIKVGGREAPVAGGPSTAIRSLRPAPARTYVPRVDSLEWYFDSEKHLFGLRNTFTDAIVIPPQFEFVTPVAGYYALVGVRDTTEVMTIDDRATYAMERVGLVNDTSGKFILRPRYTAIHTEDLGPHGYSGCVRATLPGGQVGLVSTDGSERMFKYTWVDNIQNGYARICVGGKWSVYSSGENISNLFRFTRDQALQPMLSFGKASTSKEFMDRSLVISGGKWGYVDSTGKVVIPATYDGARASCRATGIVKQEKKWGLIDMTGAQRIPCVYDGVSYLQTDSTTLVIVQQNGMRYGYIDRNGSIVIPADLKQSKPIGGGFIAFTRTGKWGVLNSKGETVCPESYHEILAFSEGKAAVRRGNKWGYIDTTGAEVIPLNYEKAGDFHEGYARVVVNHRWGFIDATGSTIIEPQFLQAGDFSGESAPAKTREGYGLIGADGKWRVKPAWQSMKQLDSLCRGIFIVRDERVFGLYRSDGKLLIAPRFEGYRYLGEGRIAYLSGTDWGLMDTSAHIFTPTIFDMIKPFSEHLAPALQDGHWGFVRTNGRYAIAPQYAIAGPFLDNRAYVVGPNGPCFIDTTGRSVFTIDHDKVLIGYSEGKYVIGNYERRRDEVVSMFYLTRHGFRVNRFDYKEAKVFSDGSARVRPAGGVTWGLISFTGYYLVKPRFFLLGAFDHGLARFQMRYTQGAFTLEGKPLLPVEYDAISFDADMQLVRFEKGNALGWMFNDGRICWPESE